MMSQTLRIEMIVFAAVLAVIIVYEIQKKKMLIRYSLVWLLIAFLLILLGLFPGILSGLCNVLGIKVPTNLLFFLGIITLLMLSFGQTCIISRQSEQIKQLIQQLSILKYDCEMLDKPSRDENQTD